MSFSSCFLCSGDPFNPSNSSFELSWVRFHLKPFLRNVAIVVCIYNPSILIILSVKEVFHLFVDLKQSIVSVSGWLSPHNFEMFSISPQQAYSFRCWFSNNSVQSFFVRILFKFNCGGSCHFLLRSFLSNWSSFYSFGGILSLTQYLGGFVMLLSSTYHYAIFSTSVVKFMFYSLLLVFNRSGFKFFLIHWALDSCLCNLQGSCGDSLFLFFYRSGFFFICLRCVIFFQRFNLLRFFGSLICQRSNFVLPLPLPHPLLIPRSRGEISCKWGRVVTAQDRRSRFLPLYFRVSRVIYLLVAFHHGIMRIASHCIRMFS